MKDSQPPNTPQIFHLLERNVYPLIPKRGQGVALPSTLVIPPGDYQFQEQCYSLLQEGLYRFLCPPQGNHQWIVYRSDLLPLLSAICWLNSHGYRDNRKSFDEVKDIMHRGKAILTCGQISAFAVQLLHELHLPARVVQCATLCERNGYSDGHILTEVQYDGRWIAFDPDQGGLYKHGGKRVNFLELIQVMASGEVEKEPLAINVPLAIGHFSAANYDYDLWMETWLARDELYTKFLQRAMQIPIIPEAGVSYFTAFSESDRRRAERLYAERHLYYLPPEEFRARFYPVAP